MQNYFILTMLRMIILADLWIRVKPVRIFIIHNKHEKWLLLRALNTNCSLKLKIQNNGFKMADPR